MCRKVGDYMSEKRQNLPLFQLKTNAIERLIDEKQTIYISDMTKYWYNVNTATDFVPSGEVLYSC
jgi:hypothetical protein